MSRSRDLLPWITVALLLALTPAAGFPQSAYDQLVDIAGKKPGDAPDPGQPACAECGGRNGKHLANCSVISGKTKQPSPGDLVLAGSLAKERARQRAAAAEVRRINLELQRCQARISSSQTIIAKAQRIGSVKAEVVARQALIKAQKAKKIYLEQLRLAKLKIARAEAAQKRLTSALYRGDGNPNRHGVVSRTTGTVTLHPAAGNGTKALAAEDAATLEPGDEILTGNGGSAEMQVLAGRGSVTLGENSRLKMERDTADGEVVRTLAGKFHFAVAKAAKFQAELEQGLVPLREKLAQTAADPVLAYEQFIKGLRAKIQKRLELRTRGSGTCSVRGTEFLVTENPDGSSDITVIEGMVEVSEPSGQKRVMVGTGQGVVLSPEGTLSAVRPVNSAALPGWWKEQPCFQY